jgi:mRNA-degrading endonuclease RelE of RelBE toxin-antitoxin system
MYADSYSEEITKKLAKLRKKDPAHYSKVRNKMDSILENPEHSYKFLHHDMKGILRVHIGHFVLVFAIDHKNKIISFEDYDHHDKIYG